MKKITRLLAMTALCGASLLYVGCAKDYSSDIEKVQKNLDELISGKVATQAQQIAALESAKTTLEGNVTTLNTSLQKVEADLATAKADLQAQIDKKVPSGQIEAVASRVTTLEGQYTTLNTEIGKINTTISSINTTLSTLASKSYVEATFATKTALEAVELTLGSLVTRVGDLEKADKQFAEDLGAVKTTAQTAAKDATTALGEIEELKKDLENYYQKGVIDGKIKNLSDSLVILNKLILEEETARDNADKLLSKTDGELQDQIDKINKSLVTLQKSVIEAENDIDELQKQYSELDKTLTNLAYTVNVTIVNRIAKDENKIDSIDELYQKADNALQLQLNNLKKDLETCEGTVDLKTKALQTRASVLHDSIDVVIKSLDDSCYVLRAQISILSGRIAQNEKDIKDIENNYNNLKQTVENNEEAIGQLQKDLATANENIKKNAEAIEQEIKDRQDTVRVISKKVDYIYNILDQGIGAVSENLAAAVLVLEAQVQELGGRVTSISVCPSTYPELVCFKEFGSENPVLVARFQIEPASMAQVLADSLDNIKVNVTAGETRDENSHYPAGQFSIEKCKVYSASADGSGILKVVVNSLPGFNASKLYFALSYTGSDHVGEYTVTSDYAHALYYRNYVHLYPANFTPSNDAQKMFPKGIAKRDTADYKTFANQSYQNFKDYKYLNFNTEDCLVDQNEYDEPFKTILDLQNEPKIYSVAKLCELTGLNLEVSYIPDEITSGLVTVSIPDTTKAYEYTLKWAGEDKIKNNLDYSLVYKVTPTINGTPLAAVMTDSYKVTKVFHDCTATKRSFYLNWNYLTYNATDRTDTLDTTADEDWKASSKEGFKCPVVFYTDSAATHPVELRPYLDGNYTNVLAMWGTESINGKVQKGDTTFIREGNYDRYQFKLEYEVEEAHPDTSRTFADITVPGSVTKPITIKLVGFAESLLKDEDGEIESRFTSGLKDVKYIDLLKAFKTQYGMSSYTITYDKGKKLSCKSATFKTDEKNETDTLVIVVNAGQLGYSETHAIKFEEESVFGFKYTANFTVKTEAPKFKLVTRPYIQSGVATVDGKVDEENKYVLDAMHYDKQVCIEDLDKANEVDGTKYTVIFTPSYEQDASGEIDNLGETEPIAVLENGYLADSIMTWGTYTGRKVDMTAYVIINGSYKLGVGSGKTKAISSNCVQKYSIQTESPVVFQTAGEIKATKNPKENVSFILTRESVVYGRQFGKVYDALNLVGKSDYIKDGQLKAIPDYGCSFDLGELNTITATINGKSSKLVKGTDYTYNPETFEMTLLLDNIYGDVYFEVPITLKHYLDYDGKKAQVQDVKVTVKFGE